MVEHTDLNRFSKVDELTSPELMPPESLTELINMTLDKDLGKAKIRNGISRYSSLQVDTTGTINNIYDVNDKDDNNYLLAAIGTKLRKSLNGTGAWSDVKTGLTDSKLRMARFGDNFFFTNGNEEPFYSDLTDTYSFKIDRPDVQLVTLTPSGTGAAIGTGEYWYILVYVLENGNKSNPSLPMQVYQTYPAIGYDQIVLGSLPVSSDTRVTSRMLFRTKANSTSNFYLVAILDNTVTTFTDTKSDTKLDTTETVEYLTTPDLAKYICTNSDSLFLANITKTYTNRVLPPTHISYNDTADYAGTEGSGSIDAGNYNYGLTFVDVNGNESELVYLFNYTFSASSKSLPIKNFPLPLVTGSFDSSGIWLAVLNKTISKINFYRTHELGANPSSPYYFIDSYKVSAYTVKPTFTDNKADVSLTSAYPVSGHGSTEQGSLKTSVVVSNLNAPLEYREEYLIGIYPDDGDEITGIFDDDNGTMVFKQKSVCKIYTNGDPTNWQVVKLSENIGCDQPDSIHKVGQTYYFVFKNRPYVFSGRGEPQQIGVFYYQTLNSVSSFSGATYDSKKNWYILSVMIGLDYYLLVYDAKLETWYKFTVKQANSIMLKNYGNDKGKIIIGGYDSYLTFYDDTASKDSDSGSDTDIIISLTSKTFTYPDDFMLARLRLLFLSYLRLNGTALGNATFKIYDIDNDAYLTYTDSDTSDTLRITKLDTDSLGSVKAVRRINFQVSGAAINELYAIRLDYTPERRGYAR